MTLHRDNQPVAHDPNDTRHNRLMNIDVGDGAMMSLPWSYWLWRLRYANDMTPPHICDDRMLAASALESYRYLVLECTKEEAWRRIKIMRSVVAANPEPNT